MKNTFTRLFLIHLLTLVALIAAAKDTITLAWDPSPDSDVTGYILYWGGGSGTYHSSTNVGNVTTTAHVVPSGTLYYYVVTAVNNQGLESDPSNEISYKGTGPRSPGSLRVTVVVQSGTNLLSWQDRMTFEMPVTAALNQEFWQARLRVEPVEPPVPNSAP